MEKEKAISQEPSEKLQKLLASKGGCGQNIIHVCPHFGIGHKPQS
jgi:hypothetical protein